MGDFTFWLGTHLPSWVDRTTVPLFLSARRLRRLAGPARAAACPIAIDSGGFTELGLHGGYLLSPEEYAAEVRRRSAELGTVTWAAQQDWMCEESRLAATGLSVAEHQVLTVKNYLRLMEIAPDIHWLPVLQGWLPEEYVWCADLFSAFGVDLVALPLVGVGSICRRGDLEPIVEVLETIHEAVPGIRLHGFGLKLSALPLVKRLLVSSDSLAWSYDARRSPPLPGHQHKNCANCLEWALRWRQRLGEVTDRPSQSYIWDHRCEQERGVLAPAPAGRG